MTSWRRVGGPEKTRTGRRIVPGSGRWDAYWRRQLSPSTGRMPVYRATWKGHRQWVVGLGWPDRYQFIYELPPQARFLAGADLRPLIVSIERSERGYGRDPQRAAFLLRFRVGAYERGNPDLLRWINPGFGMHIGRIRSIFLSMGQEELRSWVQTNVAASGQQVTGPVAISVVVAP